MIAYRCLTSEEIISMINNKDYDKALIKGGNTFNYAGNDPYKHFFLFASHAFYYMNKNSSSYVCMGQYILPDEIIIEKGFGYYGGVKTKRNSYLFSMYMPLPEIIIRKEDFQKRYLYKIESDLYGYFTKNMLDNKDNDEYGEPVLEYFSANPDFLGYTDYSYSDVYYEMVYQLALKHGMDLEAVAHILKNTDLYEEIRNFFQNNYDLFYKQTKKYIKSVEKKKKGRWFL